MPIDLDVAPSAATNLISDGACVRLLLAIRKGGADGVATVDRGLLRAAPASDGDLLLLDCKFEVTDGPYAGLAFRQSFTVAGGKRDQSGEFIGWRSAAATLRSIVDSACGLDPEDTSDAATARRRLEGLVDLDGLAFAAQVAIEPSRDQAFPSVNRLERVIPVTSPEWEQVMTGGGAGEPVPDPRLEAQRLSQAAKGQAQAGPDWLNG